MEKKIQKAIDNFNNLQTQNVNPEFSRGTEEHIEFQKNINKIKTKSLNTLLELCGDSFPNHIRRKAIEGLIEINPDDAYDVLNGWRDIIKFISGESLENHINFLKEMSKEDVKINSHEKILFGVCLYNNCHIEHCYDIFVNVVMSENSEIKHKIQSSIFLFCSDDDDYKDVSQQFLIDFVEMLEYPSEYRYKNICVFNSKTGVSSFYNSEKMRIRYDENFIYTLQIIFFDNEKNEIRDRILSGQTLLQFSTLTDKNREKIQNKLFEVITTENEDYSENVRADAADVLFRCGKGDIRLKAREEIAKLGKKDKNDNPLLSGLYKNSQNIHEFDDQINKHLEELFEYFVKEKIKLRPFEEIHRVVSEEIKKITSESENDRKDYLKAMKALNRISVDTATFTKYKSTLSEIFVCVWMKITEKKRKPSEITELKRRFIEELVDMSDTCSSGHSGRFINVLSNYDVNLTIQWDQQLSNNIQARILGSIKNLEDENLKEQLLIAQSKELASEEDNKVYNNYLFEVFPKLEDILRKEFVGEGWISEEYFNQVFENEKERYFF